MHLHVYVEKLIVRSRTLCIQNLKLHSNIPTQRQQYSHTKTFGATYGDTAQAIHTAHILRSLFGVGSVLLEFFSQCYIDSS